MDHPRVAAAVEGTELVFNAMGMPEQWVRDEEIFERVNAQGSGELARAARAAGVRRFVHTSTHDVFHAERGQGFDESRVADYPKGTAYERSKQHAEELVLAERDGMEVVILNPSGVYGPTPAPTPSFENGIFEPAIKKRLPALPPGGTGYCFTDGVAAGHLLAAEKGGDGERYILADGYASFRELAETAVRIAGRGRVPPVMPVPVAKALAATGEGISTPMLDAERSSWSPPRSSSGRRSRRSSHFRGGIPPGLSQPPTSAQGSRGRVEDRIKRRALSKQQPPSLHSSGRGCTGWSQRG